MKKFYILIGLILSVYFAQSQAIVNNLPLLKSELDTLQKNKMPLQSLAVNRLGEWVIVFGDWGYSFINMPGDVKTALADISSKEMNIKDIDFAKNGSWLILHDFNDHTGELKDAAELDAIKQIRQKEKSITCYVPMPDSGAVMIYGDNSFYKKNAPQLAVQKLKSLQDRNQRVKHFAVTPQKGWVLLYANKGMSYADIPEDLAAKLKSLAETAETIDKVFFFADKWLVIYDSCKYECNF